MKNKQKQQIILITISIIILIIVTTAIIVINKTPTEEFKSLGEEFYTNFYYPNISEDSRKDLFDSLKENGIKLSLNDIIRYKDKYTKNEISSKLQKCDLEKSIVRIYPISPYDKDDYKVEVELVC